jgi:hypothetical protein
LRWLASGHAGGRPWDAFLAPPPGWCLPRLFEQEKPMTWAEARPLLEQLTDELVAAERDGTLPDSLTPGQVWVQPNGRLLLLAAPLEGTSLDKPNDVGPGGACRPLDLLRDVAVLMLEGRPRPTTGCSVSIRTPAPEHAAQILDRLAGVTEPYERLAEFQADFNASRDRPPETTRSQRVTHLILQVGFVVLGILFTGAILTWILGTEEDGSTRDLLKTEASAIAWAILCIVWAFLFRGGWTLRLMDVALVDVEGRRASRLRCAWRALLFWLPFIIIMSLGDLIVPHIPYVSDSALLVLLLLVYLLLALLSLRRGLQDRLAGTYLVPK